MPKTDKNTCIFWHVGSVGVRGWRLVYWTKTCAKSGRSVADYDRPLRDLFGQFINTICANDNSPVVRDVSPQTAWVMVATWRGICDLWAQFSIQRKSVSLNFYPSTLRLAFHLTQLLKGMFKYLWWQAFPISGKFNSAILII